MQEPHENRADVRDSSRRTAAEIIGPYGTKRIKRRPRAAPPPARRLANYFLDQWEKTERKERPVDSIGEVTGYIRHTFLAPAAGRKYTEEEVRAFIEDFASAARRGLRIKPGQTAWKCFTGWWGRRPVVRHDPDAYDRYREDYERRLTHQRDGA